MFEAFLFYDVFVSICYFIIMGAFVITKRFDGSYKFVFTSRKGKAIFTSAKFLLKEDCERGVEHIKLIVREDLFVKSKTAMGKHFFKIVVDGATLAVSRKFTTELRLAKGIDEVIRFMSQAETLDFSSDDFVFAEDDLLADKQEDK